MEIYRSAAADTQDNRVAFMAEVARGLAVLTPVDLSAGCLTLPFGLSAWMKRSGVDLPGAVEALLSLRSAIIIASGLDQHCEPVPLVARDGRTAALSLATYLDGLIDRAAASLGTTRQELAEVVVADAA
jgi:hypothetical protein